MLEKTPLELFQRRYESIRNRYETNLQHAKQLLKKRQLTCEHNFQFYADPSGNNDSYNECSYCGKKT